MGRTTQYPLREGVENGWEPRSTLTGVSNHETPVVGGPYSSFWADIFSFISTTIRYGPDTCDRPLFMYYRE